MRTRPSPELLQWIGLFAAPAAWTVQLLVGFGASVAACGDGGRSISLETWQIAVTVAAAAVALAGQTAAAVSWRTTRGHDETDPPPAGRIRFFADAALVANTIFIVLILLGGITAAHHTPCRQS
jgi:hypothetical protein